MTEGAWYLDKGPTVFSSILGLRELVKPLTRHLTPCLSKPKGTGLGNAHLGHSQSALLPLPISCRHLKPSGDGNRCQWVERNHDLS